MNKYQQYITEKLTTSLPPPEQIIARNEAITGSYARWYLARPDLFKWAGMAISGSYEAGRRMRSLTGTSLGLELLPASFLRAQVDLLRDTNGAIFTDIGWLHAAYLAPDGGIDAIEQALDGSAAAAMLLEGFRRIEAARRERDPARRRALAWASLRFLLEHEQRNVAQPFFERFHWTYDVFVSCVAKAEFRLDDPAVRQPRSTPFLPWMLGPKGRAVRARAGAWRPSVLSFAQRWPWMQAELIPCWHALEESQPPAMIARIRALAALAPPAPREAGPRPA